MRGIFAWLVPYDRRERFTEEWAANVTHAPEVQMSRQEVEGAARRAAIRLRVRRVADVMAWRRGRTAALAGLALVCACGLVAPVAMVAALVAQCLLMLAVRSRIVPLSLMAAQAVGLVTAAVLWGISFDVADANQSAPWWTGLWMPALALWFFATIGFWVVSLREARRDGALV